MFGTLRYAPENKTGEFLERKSGMVGNAPTNKPQHSACDNCRVKKIRCSGRRTGCSRCKILSLPCSYTHVPIRKSGRKPAPSSQTKNHNKENERCPETSAALDRSPAWEATTAAAVQSSLLTMEQLPHRPDESYIELDKGMQQDQGNSNSVLDPIWKDISTWSSCLDWSPGREGTSMSDYDDPMTRNLRLPADCFSADYTRLGNTVQSPLLPPTVNGLTPPDLLPTPPLTHILASTRSTDQSSQQRPDFAMKEQSSCSCLNSAVFLLDELETPHHDKDPGGVQGLDSILSIYQEVLLLCKRMINCDTCRRKSENMMVLTMVLERLTILCGTVIDVFITQREANGPGAPPVPMAMNMMEKQPLVLGEYEIGGNDYEVMMGMLVARRLSELESLLARMKMIKSFTRRAHQQARMARVDQHIKSLVRKLTSVCPLVTEWRADPTLPVIVDAAERSI